MSAPRLQLRLYNTLTRAKELFLPAGKTVKLYTCGPTVYNYAHIGNLRTYIFEDVLRRALEFAGWRVRHAMNITDVGHLTSDADEGEDKLQRQAERERKTAWDIAAFYTRAFEQDAETLNILPPHVVVRATDTIAEQIALIQKLEKKGYTYRISDGLYYDTSKFKGYGKLARLNLAGQKVGARVEHNPEKRNPTDFALWKFSPAGKKRDMEWESPWGRGFPGWHIECSAISMSALKTPTLDIHTGGIDHIPVHHTNEIAQSEAATGKPFSRFWVHGAFLVLKDAKMAKSAGNFLTLQSVRDEGLDPLDYRFFLLQTHYRQTLAFSFDAVRSAREGLAKLRTTIQRIEHYNQHGENDVLERAMEKTHKKARAAVEDDLNMPKLVAALFDFSRALNLAMDKSRNIPISPALALFQEYDKLLAVDLFQKKSAIPKDIQNLAEQRKEARERRDFAEADRLRDEIQKKGWLVKDTSTGSEIRKK